MSYAYNAFIPPVESKKVECEYCGSHILREKEKCPHCGAPLKIKLLEKWVNK